MAKTTKPKKTAKAKAPAKEKAKAKAPAKPKVKTEEIQTGESQAEYFGTETKKAPAKEKAPALQTFDDAILKGHAAHFGHYTEKAPREFKPATLTQLQKRAQRYIEENELIDPISEELLSAESLKLSELNNILTAMRKAAR